MKWRWVGKIKHDGVVEALKERGLDDTQIESMSADDLFAEYCNWHGLIHWAPTLISALDSIKQYVHEREHPTPFINLKFDDLPEEAKQSLYEMVKDQTRDTIPDVANEYCDNLTSAEVAAMYEQYRYDLENVDKEAYT